jgi:hypothetical protein
MGMGRALVFSECDSLYNFLENETPFLHGETRIWTGAQFNPHEPRVCLVAKFGITDVAKCQETTRYDQTRTRAYTSLNHPFLPIANVHEDRLKWVEMPETRPAIERLPASTQAKLRSTQLLTSVLQIVSELVQNSLDANATRVDVGLDCKEWMCWVRDDGQGINKAGLENLGLGEEGGRYSKSL